MASSIRRATAGRASVDAPSTSIQRVWADRSFTMAELIVRRLFPASLITEDLAQQTRSWLEANDGPPALRRIVGEHLAGLERALAAQACDSTVPPADAA